MYIYTHTSYGLTNEIGLTPIMMYYVRLATTTIITHIDFTDTGITDEIGNTRPQLEPKIASSENVGLTRFH